MPRPVQLWPFRNTELKWENNSRGYGTSVELSRLLSIPVFQLEMGRNFLFTRQVFKPGISFQVHEPGTAPQYLKGLNTLQGSGSAPPHA